MKELNENEELKVTGGRKRDKFDFSTLEEIENSPIIEQLKDKLLEIKNSVDFTELNESRIFEISRRLKIIVTANGYTVYEIAMVRFIKKYWDII